MFFSLDSAGLMSFREEENKGEMPFLPRRGKSTCCQHDPSLLMLTLITELESLSTFSALELPFTSVYTVLFGRKSPSPRAVHTEGVGG